jgi:hypothetical protein
MINWKMSTSLMQNVTINVVYVSYYDEDEEVVDIDLQELLEQPNTTITDYGLSL